MNESKSIKNWSEEEQPRERLLHKGASALKDSELLAILIATGTKKRSAIGLAEDVLNLSGGNLRELGRLSVEELQQINGIGEAKAITICAALELGRRRQASAGIERDTIKRSIDTLPLLRRELEDLNHEAFCVVYLNSASKILKHEKISSGGIAATVVDIRIILKNCLLHNASQIVVAHNHPSGSLKPSEQDKYLTAKLKEGAALMDIQLLDHIIIAGDNFLSMSDEGLM